MRAIPQRQPLFLGGSIGGVPSFDLNFARGDNAVTKYGFVFTRATSATYVNSTGLIATAASGELRYTYDPVTLSALGVLIEEQRTNLLLNSETLSTQTVTVTAVAHTLSFYGTGSITLSGVSTAGPLTGTGAYPTRVTLTFTPTAGSLTLTVSGSVLWAQLEVGSFATSWIPTTGTAATRNADVLSLTGAAGRTNLLSYSETFSNAAWTKSGLLAFGSGSTEDAVANPLDGALTADKITEDSTTGLHAIYRSSNATSYNGSVMTVSVYACRAAGSRNLNVSIASDTGFANFARYVVDLGSGAVSTVATGGTAPTSPSCTATAIGGGWYRVAVSATLATAGGYAIGFYIDNNTAASNDSFAGDGTSALYLYGAQLEVNSSATTYIPTTSGPRTVENIASWFNGDAGTWVVSGICSNTEIGVTKCAVVARNAANSERHFISRNSGNAASYTIQSGGSNQYLGSLGTVGTSQVAIAATASSNDAVHAYNGTLASIDTSVVLPYGLTVLEIGTLSGSNIWCGTISRIRYYPRRLPNATLQSLTA